MRFVRPSAVLLASAVLFAACSGSGANQTTRPTQGTASAAPSTAASAAPSTGMSSAPSTGPTTSASMAPSASAAAATPSAAGASPSGSHAMGGSHSPMPSASAGGSGSGAAIDSAAANLRTDLNYLLGEHIILASKATGAALDGRNEEFAAYGELLNANGTDVGAMIGAAFGDDAKDEFNTIWSAHNGFFVDYTTGVATDDKAMQDEAVENLTTVYVPEFSALLAGATGLPEDAVGELTTEHVVQTKAVVDAQASGDWEAAYDALRTAYAHMQMIGDALAPAIATKAPDAFAGDPATKAVGFRVALNQLLQEHLYLASAATGAALDGRSDEFAAAGEALNANGTDIGAAIGSLYGDAAKDEFNKIWSAHNGFFVDYTTGVATKDKAMQDKAVQDLTTVYVPQFAAFLASATDLPEDALVEHTTEHVVTTKAIVDAQDSGDAAAAATADREAAQHMRMIGDPLAAAIVAKVPASFE